MTVSSTSSRVVYDGDGATTAWPFAFKIPDSSSIVVVYTDATGTDHTLSYGTDYTATGFNLDAGGTVTYPLSGSPIAVGTQLTIYRNVAVTQPTSISNQGAMWPTVIEAALDRLTFIAQKVADGLSRALVISPTDGITLNQLPNATTRKNSVLGFDGSGQPYAATLTGSLVSVATWLVQNFLNAGTSAAAARTALLAAGTTGDETIAGNKTFSGNESFTGANSHSGTETFTGEAVFSKLAFASGSSILPQGRLTLATATPVMASAQTGKTLVYYTPYVGNLVPVSDGTQFMAVVFAELSNDLTASSTGKAGPAAATTNSNYDLFVWSDAGTLRLTRGGAWNSDTARSSTTENDLQRINGFLTNKNAITNGPGANLGLYVGTIRTDGSSQANWQPGAIAANGTAALLNVWNAFNRIKFNGLVGDTTDSWNYTTATVRAANASNTMRASFVQGLQEDEFWADYRISAQNSAAAPGVLAGIGYDSTSALSGRYAMTTIAATTDFFPVSGDHSVQALGFHYMQACEYSTAAGTTSWYGDNGGVQQSGLRYRGRF